LIEAGFDTFIDLTRPDEMFPYKKMLFEQAAVYNVKVTYDRFPIGDFGLPTPKLMNALLDRIEESLRSEHKLYLHCWGGIGRTGTTVGCYLVRGGKTGEEALRQLADWWKSVPKSIYHQDSPETSEQKKFILNWAEHDHKFQKTGN
jgi:predicted protein tyrosine phosphatase